VICRPQVASQSGQVRKCVVVGMARSLSAGLPATYRTRETKSHYVSGSHQ
jgi:hypothetical protein